MKYLLIANKGTLEIEALTLLGASTKRQDLSKIGKFGSGNKYALSYFMRNNCSIRIFSGNEEILISLSHKRFRDQEFDVININGNDTSITTEFGYDWTTWQAVRELYSNAVDEGLLHFGIVDYDGDFHTDDDNTTRIYVEATPEIQDFMFNIKDYIAIDNEVLFECEYGKIYRKHSKEACVYYRGIKCYETTQDSIFNYDLFDVTIGENRLIRYTWDLPQNMWKIIFSCDNVVIVRMILSSIQKSSFIENLIDGSFVTVPDIKYPLVWSEALSGNTIVPRDLGGYVTDEDRPKTLFLPSALYNALIDFLGNTFKNKSFMETATGHYYKRVKPDIFMNAALDEVIEFFKSCNYPIGYDITVVEFKDVDVMGMADNNEILLSNSLFSKGKNYIASTIIEEMIHLRHNVRDESRGFQQAAIEEFLSYMKQQNAIIL